MQILPLRANWDLPTAMPNEQTQMKKGKTQKDIVIICQYGKNKPMVIGNLYLTEACWDLPENKQMINKY